MGRREVFIAIVGLIVGAAILLILLAPRVTGRSPESEADSARQPIRLTFNRPVDPESLEDRFVITPPVDGRLMIDGKELTFQPRNPLEYGRTYTVKLAPGVRGSNGLPLLGGSEWSFTVGQPKLIYLLDASGAPNLWQREAEGATRQLTFEAGGVWDYSVPPDGRGILYSAVDEDETIDLVLLNQNSEAGQKGDRQLLLDCQDSLCRTPQWQPLGSLVAFERQRMEDGPETTEVWLLDTASGELRAAHNPEWLADAGFDTLSSHSPRWSADGRFLAYFKPDARLVVVLDVATGAIESVPANLEIMGGWSPEGYRLAYTELAFGQQDPHEHEDIEGQVISHTQTSLYSHVVVSDFELDQVVDLSQGQESSDGRPAWHPQSDRLVTGRTLTGSGRQIWQIPVDGKEPAALTEDPFFHHTAPVWSPDGRQLTFMRLDVDGDGSPSVWLMDLENGQMEMAAKGAFMPGWRP